MTIIDDIKERIKIEDLVGELATVRLRKSGANMVGFCPFHNNHETPALVIWRGSQTWKCFGACNEGGDIFDWVMRQNSGWDVKEAIKFLAAKVGIEQRGDGVDLKARLSAQAKDDALKVAGRVFRRWLLGDGAGKEPDAEALAYALDRGWTLQTIKAAGIGFSGRATAAHVNEMRGEFQMHGIDLLSPEAVMILGFKGDVSAWAQAHGLDPNDLGENYIQGLMAKPGLVYPHKTNGKIEYFSVRFLPGFDGERKSHNPNATLAGPRRPFFNWLHRGHHAEGQEKGKRLHIVEGQGCAVTWGQFGEAAMALCGSSWQYLMESGIVDQLKAEYEEIFYAADADTPGEAVLTGKNGNFPLSTAFGPGLWVERMPQKEWQRPDGKSKKLKDTNDIAQYVQDVKLDDEQRKRLVDDIIGKAEPIVVLAARYAGCLEGQLRETAIEQVVRPLIIAMPHGRRVNYAEALAEALYPEMSKTNRRDTYNKWLTGELRRAAKEDQDEVGDYQTVVTLGGWYPDDETENSGYLIDSYFDHKAKKIRFAYAHILDMKANKREVNIAPYLVIRGKKYEPPDGDENIESGAVKLPSGLGAVKTSADLIKLMAEYYQKYFYLDEKSQYRFCASYALFTWVHDSFEALNFLHARGGSGSGKSDLMYLVGLTSYRFAVTLAITTSAAYRGIVKLYRATVMVDEADNLMKKDDGTMEAFLKGRSMKRYANAMNCVEVMGPNGKIFVPSSTNVYGPTLITGYHPFKDPGINNRCVPINLSQVDTFTLEAEGIEPGYYPPELEGDADEIRNMALRWRLETWMPKIELTPEQRKEHRLADKLVSPRVNQVLRPMKVLAVLQGDMDLLAELKMIGQASYEDEMIKRAGSFEALILRAIVALDIAADVKTGVQPIASAEYAQKVKEHAVKVKIGQLGRHGVVRYALYKDIAELANLIMDAENVAVEEGKKRDGIKGRTIGDVSRESFRLPVERTGGGWAVVLERSRIEIAKLRFGLDREADYKVVAAAPEPKQVELPSAVMVDPSAPEEPPDDLEREYPF